MRGQGTPRGAAVGHTVPPFLPTEAHVSVDDPEAAPPVVEAAPPVVEAAPPVVEAAPPVPPAGQDFYVYLKGQQLSRFRWGDDGIVYDGDRQIKAGACCSLGGVRDALVAAGYPVGIKVVAVVGE